MGLASVASIKQPFLGRFEQAGAVFHGRIRVHINVELKRDGCGFIRIAALADRLPLDRCRHIDAFQVDPHALGERPDLRHQAGDQTGTEIRERQRCPAFAAVKPRLVGGHVKLRLDRRFHLPAGDFIPHLADGRAAHFVGDVDRFGLII